ncbi:MAG: hypothetical protein ACLSWM_06335 [Barnesiella sp.]|nr:hypothetical protein [Barnesiella sp. GGCC_0306]MBS7040841.1 hypothetical protein [Bacteroidales bacterium]
MSRIAISPVKIPVVPVKPIDHFKSCACATYPITGGFVKNPRNPMVEKMANVIPGSMVFDSSVVTHRNDR